MKTERKESMKQLLEVAVCLLTVLMVSPQLGLSNAFAKEEPTLRLMTYNIHHGEGMDGKLDLERIAAIIRKHDCDLVALQEVDRNTKRSKNIDQIAELGRLAGMQHYFAKAIDYSDGEYGLGILSKIPVKESKSMRLPSGPKREQRIALEVILKPDHGSEFVFVTTHLDSSAGENDRKAQNDELARLFGDLSMQVILAGDFNSPPDKPELNSIVSQWIDVDSKRMSPTIPVSKPNRKIDYIFLKKNAPWKVERAEVLDEPIASDHLPLFAVLRFATGK